MNNNKSSIKERLEYLRTELRAERISYGELVELQNLAGHIDPIDVELLEAAGVSENQNKNLTDIVGDEDPIAIKELLIN